MKRIAGALLALFLVAGCSSASDGPLQADNDRSRSEREAERGAAAERDGVKAKKGRHEEREKDGLHGKGSREARSNGGGSSTTTDDDGSSTAARPEDRDGTDRGVTSTRSRRPEPKSGRYVYAQSGWEGFCAATCHRSDLPPSAAIDTRVSAAGSDRLRIVSESQSSENRSMRSTSFLSQSALDIAEVELRYGNFSDTYHPSPPVRSLRLPLSVGNAWTSSWRAETSGDYVAEVIGIEQLVVGERTIKTYKLDTVTTFRGGFRGSLRAIVWVDPATATTIRTHGKARIATDYGRLNSNFDTMLIEGPGYE